MDPISATSLAAAIIQLADFSGKVFSRSRELHLSADGALLKHTELATIANNFRQLLKSLRKDDKLPELSNLVIEAESVTNELLTLLQELAGEATVSKTRWSSVRQALLTIGKDRELCAHEERISVYRKQLDTALLIDLKTHVAQLQRQQSESTRVVDGFYALLSQSSASYAKDLQALPSSVRQSPPTGLEVTKQFSQQLLVSLTRRDQRQRDEFLAAQIKGALRHKDLPLRHKAIPETYAETFEWIFKEPKDHASSHMWDDFSAWLTSDRGLYWIVGKPGAGKSTLMKYLFQHPKTRALVDQWPKVPSAERNEVITAGFFFWNSGTQIQMSRAGFLRSLLTQVLQSLEDSVVSSAFAYRWKRSELLGWSEEDFTWEELHSALDIVLSTDGRYFLLFIDGLDEFEGNKDELADVVIALSRKSRVKVISASRPWVEFESKFAEIDQLLVERLTHDDLVKYVNGRFAESREFNSLRRTNTLQAQELLDGIVNKASGVFLWVYVVVSSLLHGLRDGDRMKTLKETLEALPPELDTMFDKILGQVRTKHKKEASELFQFVRNHPEKSTLISLYWSQMTLSEVVGLEVRAMPDEEAGYITDVMRRNLLSRCKCLLDTGDESLPTSRVTWLHRTAREFIERPVVWNRILDGSPDYNAGIAYSLSLLAQAKSSRTSSGSHDRHVQSTFEEAVSSAKFWAVEDRTQYLDHIESVGRSKFGPRRHLHHAPGRRSHFESSYVRAPDPAYHIC